MRQPQPAAADAGAPDESVLARAQVEADLEALLLLATEPLPVEVLAEALQLPAGVVTQALHRLASFYDETGRGFELREVGTGWRYYTRPEHHDVIAAWVLEGQQARLSQAALETLLSRMRKTESNREFLIQVTRTTPSQN